MTSKNLRTEMSPGGSSRPLKRSKLEGNLGCPRGASHANEPHAGLWLNPQKQTKTLAATGDVVSEAAAESSAVGTLEDVAKRIATCFIASDQNVSDDDDEEEKAHDAAHTYIIQLAHTYIIQLRRQLRCFEHRSNDLDKIAACIRTGETWETMARRVLVAGAMLLQGREDLVIPDNDVIVEQCAAMPKNEKWFLLAVKGCRFKFSQVLHPAKPTLGELIARLNPNPSVGRKFLAADGAACSLSMRQILKGGDILHACATVKSVLDNEINGTLPPKVVVVSGTSGSGKTIGALEAATRFACGLFHPAVSTLYMLASDMEGIGGLDENTPRSERNSIAVEALLTVVRKLVPTAPAKRAGRETTTAVIVVDEVGEYGHFVRGVCAVGPLDAVREHLNVDRVVVMVVGTGVDVATNTVGSSPDTFVRAQVDSSSVSLCLLREAAKLPQECATAALRPMSPLERLLQECDAWRRALEHAPRLRATLDDMSHNPRMVAILKEHLKLSSTAYECDVEMDLAAQLERGVDYALETFVKLNSLGNLDFNGLLRSLSHGFGMSLDSGVNATPCDSFSELVVRKFGLVADVAEWVPRNETAGRTVVKRNNKALADKSPDGRTFILCLPEGHTQRYAMSPAMIALSFRLFGRRYPEWSGEGLERTLAEYLSWVVLAAHSGVAITISDADPLARLKRALVEMGLDDDGAPRREMTLWRVVLDDAVTSVEAAATALTKCAAAGGAGRHVVVALNAPKAPFADILIGAVQTGSTTSTLRAMVLIRAKHLPESEGRSLGAVLPPAKCHYELAKMGYVSRSSTMATAWDALGGSSWCQRDVRRCASALVRLGYSPRTLEALHETGIAQPAAKAARNHPVDMTILESLKMVLQEELGNTTVRSSCLWVTAPSSMRASAGLKPASTAEVNEVARVLGYVPKRAGGTEHPLAVLPPDGCQSEAPQTPKTAWFIVLRAPVALDGAAAKDAAHPDELLWFNDSTARVAFSPSSLGKFVMIKRNEMAPLHVSVPVGAAPIDDGC